MRFAFSLLWSLAGGCGMYAAAAVVWSTLDPDGAGRTLLFTIPLAVVAMIVLGLIATAALFIPLRSRGDAGVGSRRVAPATRGREAHAKRQVVGTDAVIGASGAKPQAAVGDDCEELVLAA